eukprot:COSAG03_NODE_7572_length_899_cov_0.840000_2_plen_61_part_01
MWVGGGLCWLAFAGSTLEFESVVKVGSRWSGTAEGQLPADSAAPPPAAPPSDPVRNPDSLS